MKVLDVQSFQVGLKEIQPNLKALNQQVLDLENAVKGMIELEESLKGNGGDSIRNYYQQVHQTFLTFFQLFIRDYDKIIENIKQALYSFESAENGWIHEAFIDSNVQPGLKQIKSITESLTDEANHIMATVDDLVYLPRLKEEETLMGIEQAKAKAKTTVEKLYLFDKQATQALEPVEKDLKTMTTFVQKAESMFKGDKQIIIDFKPEKLLENAGYRGIVGELIHQSNMAPLQTVNGEAYGNFKWVKYQFYANGLIVKEYQNFGSDQVYYEVVKEIDKGLKDGIKLSTTDKIISGIVDGSNNAVEDTVLGLLSLINGGEEFIAEPKETLNKLLKGLKDLPENALNAIATSFKSEIINGDAKSRSEYITYLLTSIGIGLVGDKGATELIQGAKKVSKISKVVMSKPNKNTGLTPAFEATSPGAIPNSTFSEIRKIIGDGGKGTKGMVNPAQSFTKKSGRSGKQTRLKEIANDDKSSSALRGEIKRDINEIAIGKRKNIRVPQGHELAHRRGYEARKGYGYEHSDLQVIKNHRTQHKHDGYGKKKK